MIEEFDIRINKILQEALGISYENIEDYLDTKLCELGLNSVNFIKLIVGIESEFDIEFDDDALLLYESETIKGLKEFILKMNNI